MEVVQGRVEHAYHVQRVRCAQRPVAPVSAQLCDRRIGADFSVARNFQLRLSMRQVDKPRVTFDGFRRDVSCHRRFR